MLCATWAIPQESIHSLFLSSFRNCGCRGWTANDAGAAPPRRLRSAGQELVLVAIERGPGSHAEPGVLRGHGRGRLAGQAEGGVFALSSGCVVSSRRHHRRSRRVDVGAGRLGVRRGRPHPLPLAENLRAKQALAHRSTPAAPGVDLVRTRSARRIALAAPQGGPGHAANFEPRRAFEAIAAKRWRRDAPSGRATGCRLRPDRRVS